MQWPFGIKDKHVNTRIRNLERELKVFQSQQALLEAATSTADAANIVTNSLRLKLEDSVNQIENTSKILNDALIICDVDGKIQGFNPAAEHMFKMTADSVRNTFVGDLFQHDGIPFVDGHKIWDTMAEIELADGAGLLQGVRLDGSTFPVDVNHARLDRSDGSTIMLLILRDISFFADTAKLKDYRSIFEVNFDGILVVENQRILAANPSVTKLFGYTVEELLSKPIDMLFVSPKSDDVFLENTSDQEFEGKHHDGHPMNLFFTTTAIWWNGSRASLITIKSIPHNSNAVVYSDNMFCCFDTNFTITFANNAFGNFYGVKKESLVGRDIRKLMPEEESHPFLLNVSSLTPSEPTRRMQLRSTNEKGEERIQCWTDHASYDEKDVEYQRIGYCTVKVAQAVN